MFDTKIQTPMHSNVLSKSKKRAEDLGFSSVNDVVRLLLKSFSDGDIDILVSTENKRSYKEILDTEVLDLERDIKSGKAEGFDSVDELMGALNE